MQLAANMNDSPISPIEDILEDARNGRPYVLVDAEDREGVTTGISAADRARTVQVAADPTKGADDIVSPGHVFPLVARDGGVLVRTGHTEAAVDISRMAGLTPAGVICEIMNDDGSMARMPDLIAFAQLHGLKIGTIADLIAYRRRTERFVERVMDTPFQSVHGGPFRLMLYRNTIEGAENVALVHGRIEPGKPTLVRMHQIDFAADLLGHVEARQDYVPRALKAISDHPEAGVAVFLRDPAMHGLAERLAGPDAAAGAPERSLKAYGVGAQILLAMACASGAGATWMEGPSREGAAPRADRRGALLRRPGRRPAGRRARGAVASRGAGRCGAGAGRAGDPADHRHGR